MAVSLPMIQGKYLESSIEPNSNIIWVSTTALKDYIDIDGIYTATNYHTDMARFFQGHALNLADRPSGDEVLTEYNTAIGRLVMNMQTGKATLQDGRRRLLVSHAQGGF